jgi:hypothetical protein
MPLFTIETHPYGRQSQNIEYSNILCKSYKLMSYPDEPWISLVFVR